MIDQAAAPGANTARQAPEKSPMSTCSTCAGYSVILIDRMYGENFLQGLSSFTHGFLFLMVQR
jgi:hypothetical protein